LREIKETLSEQSHLNHVHNSTEPILGKRKGGTSYLIGLHLDYTFGEVERDGCLSRETV